VGATEIEEEEEEEEEEEAPGLDNLTQVKDQCRALVNTLMNLLVP
jgi:hypothetical protein